MYSFLTKRPFPFHLKLSIHFLLCTPPPPTFSPLNLDLDFVYCQEAVGVPACDFARSAKQLCKKFKGGKKTLKERGENWHSFVVVCCYCKYEHIYSGYLNVEKKTLFVQHTSPEVIQLFMMHLCHCGEKQVSWREKMNCMMMHTVRCTLTEYFSGTIRRRLASRSDMAADAALWERQSPILNGAARSRHYKAALLHVHVMIQ